jgi:acetylglutamate kinase
MYKGKTFVVKVGGRVLQKKEALDALLEDISLLHQVGIRIVFVHGGGAQATEMSKKLGLETKMVNGRRVTDAQTLEVAKMVYAGTLSVDILSAFRQHGTPAAGLSGVDAGLITARKRSPHPVDYGFVGDVESVNPSILENLLTGGTVPVVASLASDAAGQVLNMNADTVARCIAVAMKAEKLLILTDVDGVMKDPMDPSTLISSLEPSQIPNYDISGGMLPKVDACLSALKGGVRRAHILNGMKAGALLTEIFTNAGCGTMIAPSEEKKEPVLA